MSHGYRRSYNDLAYGDDYGGGGGGQRWDRDRFDRMRARSRGPRTSGSFRVEERDSYGPGGGRRDFEFDERFDSRGGRGQREAFFEEDRYAYPRRSRPEFFEEDRFRTSGRELAPYNDRYQEPPRPSRPGYSRRQSSWDAYDRRPIPRYDDHGHDDVKVSVQVNDRYEPEPRYEEPRYERRWEPDPDYREFEDYRDAHIVRERVIDRRIPPAPEFREREEERFEEVIETPRRQKRGKTRMPKRLVHKKAILDLGYPFEEEENFYVVRLALEKEQIDECIKISETYRETERSFYEPPKALEAPPPAASHVSHRSAAQEEQPVEITETVTTKIIENPTPSEYGEYAEGRGGEEEHKSVHESHESVHGSVHESVRERDHVSHVGLERTPVILEEPSSPTRNGNRGRSKSRARSRHRSKSRRERFSEHEEFEERDERFEESAPIGGPLTLLVPDRTKRKSRDIKSEIKALEAEKRALKYEREADEKRRKAERIRIEEDEVDEKERDVVRVEKDRRGRLNLVRSSD